jgi:hypothetical protein
MFLDKDLPFIARLAILCTVCLLAFVGIYWPSCKIPVMHIFYDTIECLHHFTQELDYHSLECPQCKQANSYVSHGFVYKYFSSEKKVKVGKRLWCSPRGSRNGCGATLRLYVGQAIPKYRYTTAAFTVFIATLITTLSISRAYKTATNSNEPRNAHRWINALKQKLSAYRTFLHHRTEATADTLAAIPKPLRILLPTLWALKEKVGDDLGRHYQILTQSAFV